MAEKTVKEYQAIAEEARRDVVRAKLRETIRDMRAGKQQISENSLYGDNEIGILHNMLKDAGLKKDEDYIDESEIDPQDLKRDSHFTFTNIGGQSLQIFDLKEGTYFDGCVSRKKHVIPILMEVFEK